MRGVRVRATGPPRVCVLDRSVMEYEEPDLLSADTPRKKGKNHSRNKKRLQQLTAKSAVCSSFRVVHFYICTKRNRTCHQMTPPCTHTHCLSHAHPSLMNLYPSDLPHPFQRSVVRRCEWMALRRNNPPGLALISVSGQRFFYSELLPAFHHHGQLVLLPQKPTAHSPSRQTGENIYLSRLIKSKFRGRQHLSFHSCRVHALVILNAAEASQLHIEMKVSI